MTPEQIVAFENYIAAERELAEALAAQTAARDAESDATVVVYQRRTKRDDARWSLLAAMGVAGEGES